MPADDTAAAANLHIDDLDDWDSLIAYLKTLAPNKNAIVEFVQNCGPYSVEAANRLTTGTAGLHGGELTPRLKKLAVPLFAWAERNLDATLEGYLEHRPKRCFSPGLPHYEFEFVGRHEELQQIEKFFADYGKPLCLLADRSPKARRIAQRHQAHAAARPLTGFGGQGKTAIAYHFARTHLDRYAAVLWMDARRSTLAERLEGFAVEAGIALHEGNDERRRMAYYVEALIAHFRKLLVVVDDIASPLDGKKSERARELDILLDSIPKAHRKRLHLLITCRHAILSDTIEPMVIQPLSLQDASALFLSRSNFTGLRRDDTQLLRLVDEVLGRHALSIALVAAYAREQNVRSLGTLIGRLQERIVDAGFLADRNLQEEYPNSLQAAFRLSFEALDRRSQLLLLTLSLFPRGVIAVDTLKASIRLMQPAEPEVAAFKEDFCRRGGSIRPLNALLRHALVERIVREGQGQKSETRYVQLHEIIFDFAQFVSVQARATPQHPLYELEIALTHGACKYVAAQIDQETLAFRDVDTLTGLLIPQVRIERGFIPSAERVAASLEFWFTHYKFQNFVYDTGLQENLLGQMLALRDYLLGSGTMTPEEQLILDKLIGHAYYADPDQTGEIARTFFDGALRVARHLDTRADLSPQRHRAVRWYTVFLLDHRSNVASKKRPGERQCLPIRDDPAFREDYDEIEKALPGSLRDLQAVPSTGDCELLLRAAHYWGHRGNQDAFILLQRLRLPGEDEQWAALVQSARNHYVRALNYRLLALRLYRGAAYKKHLAKHASEFLAGWLADVAPLKNRDGYEGFTTLHQGVGDAAHQYRGLHLVCVLDCLRSTRNLRDPVLMQSAREALRGADDLWEVAERVRAADESPIKYRLWMCSSEVVMRLLGALGDDQPRPEFEDVAMALEDEIRKTQQRLRSNYQYSAGAQLKEMRVIWEQVSQLAASV